MNQHYQAEFEVGRLLSSMNAWAKELGFQQLGISHVNLHAEEIRLQQWLRQDFHGEMAYMAKHGLKRSRPDALIPGTSSVICVRMNYQPKQTIDYFTLLHDSDKAYISRYATGRDYHKILRQRLKRLIQRIERSIGPFPHRVFTDSAPVLEKPLAVHAGLGWMGKHTNILNRQSGSWFFIGEIYTALNLPPTGESANHCGTCQACIDACPTGAIVAPYVLDARLCISYLTIEHKTSIPVALRSKIGNRIYGCDDCQLVCPWNRFSEISAEYDYQIRNGLEAPLLIELFSWSEQDFFKKMEGSAIRRIGYIQWLRNIAVALGNASPTTNIISALKEKMSHPSELVREHVQWALDQLENKQSNGQ